jgi:hypothetical protein
LVGDGFEVRDAARARAMRTAPSCRGRTRAAADRGRFPAEAEVAGLEAAVEDPRQAAFVLLLEGADEVRRLGALRVASSAPSMPQRQALSLFAGRRVA